ncbi:MAG: glycogen phosphorylase [Spirochaetales bacterium]|nr:MAG: glycogen phosphorylase [Spirochaetales bacterium]
MILDKKAFKERVFYWIDRGTGDGLEGATHRHTYEAVSRALMDALWEQWRKCEHTIEKKKLKRIYYFSAEFLMGRALGNNLINLKLREEIAAVLDEMGLDLNAAEDTEPDAALGNGGLGRLAACFMESLATLDLPARGYGIRYRYGMFRQQIVNGCQVEEPDDWVSKGDPWSIRRGNRTVIVRFGGRVITEPRGDGTQRFKTVDTENVVAIPYDMPIIGWDTDTINTLRLWEAESANGFNLQLFNNMEYMRAVESQARARDLSRVLYPNDSGPTGKALRLRQQYFFSSASLQDILQGYKRVFGNDLTKLPEAAAIQLNDTHPVIAIPELMRLLLDEEDIGWDDAWQIVSRTFAYTNHTVLSEALEKWPVDLFRQEFPRLFQIVEEVNRRFMLFLAERCPHDRARHQNMSIISNGLIHMAWLAIASSFSVNGVAALHTEILKNEVLKDWYELYPEKFNNKTNGVTQRRWLKKANPELSGLLDDILGTGWTKDFSQVAGLRDKADDTAVLDRLALIKRKNKENLAALTQQLTCISVDPASLFDVQIKRLHEYKRQLLNILSVIADWQALRDGTAADLPPRTVFFGAKAASGYRRAKQIIHLIHKVAEKINSDPAVSERLKVVFLPDYKVSLAEVIFPAAEISQQISTAGKEASGTGNMKFMINGAVTLGTMDGANIEIVQEAGRENAFIFGLSAEEVLELRSSGTYNTWEILENDASLNRALNTLVDGTLTDDESFREIFNSLVYGVEGNSPDEYFVLKDFASYQQTRKQAGETWKDPHKWNRMSLMNIAGSGHFSSDRTVAQYAEEIWNIKPI